MTAPEYTQDMIHKALRRLAARTPEDRDRYVSTLLCQVASDRDPVYTGTDPDTGRSYQGPEAWQAALKSLAYYVACRRTPLGAQITELTKREIAYAIQDGIRMAEEHTAMDIRAYADAERNS